MAALDEITGIGKSSQQLLKAAGIGDANELAAQDIDGLFEELKRANEMLDINERAPDKSTVMKWIAEAIELIGETPDPEWEEPQTQETSEAPDENSFAVPVNYEGNEEVAEMLSRAPCAIPLPGRIMMEKSLQVADIPAGLLLNRYSGDLDIRVDDPTLSKTEVPSRRAAGSMKKVSKKTERLQFDASSAKPMPKSTGNGKRIPKSKEGHEEDRVALIRAPREKTNRGKNPESRNYVRGVLHTHPWSLRIGAIFSLLLGVNLPLAIIAAFVLLASREVPENFSWVPEWFLAFPAALPIVGLGYLIWGFSGKCRICTQKLFVHKGALKHIKAHRIPGMGYVVPLCLHLLTFSWFRCSSCGTPVRLKK